MIRAIYRHRWISVSSFTAFGIVLLVVADRSLTSQNYIPLIASFLSGVSGSIVASIFLVRKYGDNVLEEVRDSINQALNNRNSDSLASALQEYTFFRKRYSLVKVDNNLHALFESLRIHIDSMKLLVGGDFAQASRLLNQTDTSRIYELIDTFKDENISDLLKSLLENKQAISEDSGNALEMVGLKSEALDFHDQINSFSEKPEKSFECYLNIITCRSRLLKDLESDPQSILNLLGADILLTGCFGSLGLLKQQYPWEDAKKRDEIFTILDDHGLSLRGGTLHSLDDVCKVVLLHHYNVQSISELREKLTSFWDSKISVNSIGLSLLRINLAMLLDSQPELFYSELKVFENRGGYLSDCKEIIMINTIDSVIRKQSYSKEQGIALLNELVKQVQNVSPTSFYYPGLRLGIATCDINLGHTERGLSALSELAESKSNFMCSSTAARNLMCFYSRKQDTKAFGKWRQRYLDFCDLKSLNPAVLTMENAQRMSFTGGQWYFVSIPFRKSYYPIKASLWGEKILL